MKLQKVISLLILLLPFCKAFPQNSAQIQVLAYKDSLNTLARIMQRGENDSLRMNAAIAYQTIIINILNDSSSFTALFDSIPNLSVRNSPDNVIRTYTWTVPNYEGKKYFYYGLIQRMHKGKVSSFLLEDHSDNIEKPQSTKLKEGLWWGAIYYNILVHERRGKKFYTLLGWKGINQDFTQKVIDVVTFDNGKPVFGYPVFKVNNIYHSRIIFEYTSQAVMSLKPANEKMLVFDHIGKSTITGVIGPDGTYDAFKYMKDHWEFLEDVDVDNGFVPRKKEVKLFKDSELKK